MNNPNEFLSLPVLPGCEVEKYYNLEFKSTDEIHHIQEKLFMDHLKYCGENSPFYQNIFKTHCIDWQSLTTLDDITKIPLTEKDSLSEKNSKFISVDASEIVDVCLTSATTVSEPTPVLLTRNDLSRLAYNEQVSLSATGLQKDETVIIAASIDRCFMAGLAYYLGCIKNGNKVIRAGASSSAQLWQLIKLVKPETVIGVPSLLNRCGEDALKRGEDPGQSSIKRFIGIGEPLRDKTLQALPIAQQLENLWQAKTYSTYASTEMATAFCECRYQQGGHLRPELMIVEIVNGNGLPVPPGETGEVVVTPLGVNGMPLLRYRTGDLSFLVDKPCRCGRNTIRLGPVLGRKKQMLKIKGTTTFPNILLNALQGINGIAGGFVEAHLNSDGTDRVMLYAAVENSAIEITPVREKVQAVARVLPEIKTVTVKEFENKTRVPDKRKRVTFFDLRHTT
ncbi:MAG: AMP-binding protein [Desulfobacterales bacterium]|nr:AMP-binding protein [Desulfobacterales bacterium]